VEAGEQMDAWMYISKFMWAAKEASNARQGYLGGAQQKVRSPFHDSLILGFSGQAGWWWSPASGSGRGLQVRYAASCVKPPAGNRTYAELWAPQVPDLELPSDSDDAGK
jgi:hypothetical protein